MKDLKVMFSHNTDDWKTPSVLFNAFMNKGYLDLCPFQFDGDNLHNVYYGEKIYINPPFSKLNELVDFICINLTQNKVIYLLMPSRTDTDYFYKFMGMASVVYFIKGRLHFNDLKTVAPFPTLIIKFLPNRLFGVTCCKAVTLDEFISLIV